MVTLLQLDVARLKKSPGESDRYNLAAELPPIELSGERLTFSSPVSVSVVVSNTGKALAVEGKACGKLRLNCGRCLETFEHTFEAYIQETYTQAESSEGDEAVRFSGDFIDIGPEVLKSIILSLPMKAVCRDDCPGLCPKCGHNLNESGCGCTGGDADHRFSILKELLKEKQLN